MLLLDKQDIQDMYIFEYSALLARKWSGFICKRASEDRTLSCYIGLLKKEERMPNEYIFTSRCAYIICAITVMLFFKLWKKHNSYEYNK